MMHRHLSEIQNFGGLGETSRVIFELKPFGIYVRGQWVPKTVWTLGGKNNGNSRPRSLLKQLTTNLDCNGHFFTIILDWKNYVFEFVI